MEVYRNGLLVGARDVSGWPDYASGGYIGLYTENDDDTVLDDFGGGTVLSPPPLVAAFSAAPLIGTVPLTVTFTNESTNADDYLWDFGDGVTSTLASPNHTYTQPGVYTAMKGMDAQTVDHAIIMVFILFGNGIHFLVTRRERSAPAA